MRYLGGARDRDPADEFQRRFLVGCDVTALVTATTTLPAVFLEGQYVTGLVLGGFVLVLAVLALALRAGLALSTTSWANLGALTLFLFLVSITTPELHVEQLAWLTLLPIASALAARPGADAPSVAERYALFIGCGAAVLVTLAILGAHRAGLTFHEPLGDGSTGDLLASFLPLLFAVTALIALLIRLLRAAETENRDLRSLLAVCAWCHKIRNDAGHWEPIGKYMHDRGTAVTHGMCEACLDKLEDG